jgi:hypothetical protein
MKWRFQDKTGALNTCTSLASRMQIMEEANMKDILYTRYVTEDFDHEKIKRIGEELCKHD